VCMFAYRMLTGQSLSWIAEAKGMVTHVVKGARVRSTVVNRSRPATLPCLSM
jgi:hypothetical protein